MKTVTEITLRFITQGNWHEWSKINWNALIDVDPDEDVQFISARTLEEDGVKYD